MRLIDADALLEAIDIKIIFKTDEPINDAHKLINDSVVDEVKKATEQYRQCIRNIITNAPTVQREGLESAIKDLIFIDKKLSNKKILDLNKIYGRWFIKNRHLLISLIPAAPTDME